MNGTFSGQNHDAPNDEVATPPGVFAAINKVFHFDLDAAALPENAKCARYWTPADNSLDQQWHGRVWLNPPYSDILPWAGKAAAGHGSGRAEVIVMLVPARTGTRWFRAATESGAKVVPWPVRLAFNGVRVPWDSVLLVWGGRTLTARQCRWCRAVFLGRKHAQTCSERCRKALSRSKDRGCPLFSDKV